MAGELQVIDRSTGEVIDVKQASTDRLAQFLQHLEDLRDHLGDAEAVVHSELVGRMDRAGTWTHRVRVSDGVELELKTPSPKAGTVSHDAELLEVELSTLIERGTIDPAAAAAALKRSLGITVTVPFEVPVEAARARVEALFAQSEETADWAAPEVEITRSVRQAGINALAKIPGTKSAIERAVLRRPPGRRKVKITAKGKGR